MLEHEKQKNKLVPLRQFAENGPYKVSYLSILVQRKKLKAKKVGRNYFTSQKWFDEYMEMHARDEKRIEQKIENEDAVKEEFLKVGDNDAKGKTLRLKKEKISKLGVGLGFFVSEKARSAKDEAIEKLLPKPWLLNLILVSFAFLFFSTSLVRFSPGVSSYLIGVFDSWYLSPVRMVMDDGYKKKGKVAGVSEEAVNENEQSTADLITDAQNEKDGDQDKVSENLVLKIINYAQTTWHRAADFFGRYVFYDSSSPPKEESKIDNNHSNNSGQGVVVVPYENEKEAEEISKTIKSMFSDRVEVETGEGGRGIIKPVFDGKQDDQKYLYMMVPVTE